MLSLANDFEGYMFIMFRGSKPFSTLFISNDYKIKHGLPRWLSGKESACQCRRLGFDPWVREIPWRKKWQPTLVFLSGEFHGQRSLVGYNPWGHKESDKESEQQNNNHQSVQFSHSVVSDSL